MTPLNRTASPTLYDQWQSFCTYPPDKIVHQGRTLFVGSDCKAKIHCPRDFSGSLENFVVCGVATLVPDGTTSTSDFRIKNIYVLGGTFESHGVVVIANRIIQLTRSQFEDALSTLFVQGSDFKPIDPRKKETPPSRFTRNVFQIATETPLERLHVFKGLRTLATNGEEDYVKLFIAAKADVNQGIRFTPLTQAATHNQAEVVDLLVNANAHLEKPDVTGSTPLICAAANNAVEAAKLLLAGKADVNATNYAHQTPLAAALSSSSLNMINFLNDFGIDLNTSPPGSNSMSAAVMHAIGNGLVQKLSELLAQGFNIEATSGTDDTSLTLAAQYGQDQIVDLLLAHSANTEARGNRGTALEIAMCNNCPTIITLLITEDPTSAIKMLMDHPDPKVVAKKFLQMIPDPIAFGRQALNEAVRLGKKNTVEALLTAGIRIGSDLSNKEETTFGEELLLRTVLTANFEIVTLLVDAKANIHSVDSQGITLLMQVRLLESELSIPQGEEDDTRPDKFLTRSDNYKKIIELLITFGATDGVEAFIMQKSVPSKKQKKSVQFAENLSTTETIDFAALTNAQTTPDVCAALNEVNKLMQERNYGCTCTERRMLEEAIEKIERNKKINKEDPNLQKSVFNLKNTSKTLPKKDQLQFSQKKKPAISDYKSG